MTIELSRTRTDRSAHTVCTLAVISPLLSGVVWGTVAFLGWRDSINSPDANLGTLFAFWAVLFYGFIGLGLLAIPITIGLVARGAPTRLAAAWVEAGLCALVAALWTISVIPDDYRGAPELFDYFTIGALLVPMVTTFVATRLAVRQSLV